MKAIVKAKFGVTSFGVVVKHSIILGFTGDAVRIVITSLAVVRTVGTKLLVAPLTRKLRKTHIQTEVVSAQIVRVVTTEAISEVQAGHTLRGTRSTY